MFYSNFYLDDDDNVHLDEYKFKLEDIIKLPNSNKHNVINQISWITKALTLKGHNKMLIWIDWVIS